ncbi:MAG: hypothetical protein MJH10_18200 [Epibacterium sp.]|nr:hypothetical protein [Epibacterium sp.]NQX75422.1 hypothetical protein [Epibacterium sp.]
MSDMDDLNEIIDETVPEPEAVQAEPEPVQEPVQQEATPEPQPEPMVPHAVVGELRGENRALKAQLADIQQRLNAQPAPQPQQLPDVLENPDGYNRAIQAQFAQMQSHMTAQMSEALARNKHSDGAVDAAYQAAQDAGVIDQFKGQPDPWGQLVKWHQAETVRQEIGDDLVGYKARVEAEALEKARAELAAQQTAAAVASAPSLAGQTSIGGRAAQAPVMTSLDDILGS